MIRPSERQLKWHEIEFYSFVHFTVNTYTDREWGLGNEDPAIFNPVELNADQWVEACVSAGMKGLILTCKHHDGFCLWPSKYTEHSVKNSPWKDGKGDIVKETSEACRKAGIKFGVYLSPWDRHEKTYGDSPKYNEYFKNQLRELLTNYGDIFCVWFDGCCGEGPDGKKQMYDWDGYYEIIRELQPDAVIFGCGPDIRWCGNEAGDCRESEWSVVPASLKEIEKIKNYLSEEELSNRINSIDPDLGSREIIKKEDELVWYPAEVDVSIRPGWFYHESEDDKVKSTAELLKIYYGSVGGNASLLLNIPPDKRGLFHENDVARLKELGQILKNTFSINLAKGAGVTASNEMDEKHGAANVLDMDKGTYWCPGEEAENAYIVIDLNEEKSFDRVVITEHIKSGQRVERFTLEYKESNQWKEFYKGTVIGNKRICCFDRISSRHIRFTVTESRWCPEISGISVHLSC